MEIYPADNEVDAIITISFISYGLPFIFFLPIKLKYEISDCLFIEAKPKNKNIENANNQTDNGAVYEATQPIKTLKV